MKEKWAHLSLRDKQAVILGIAVCTIALLYSLIWTPLSNSVIALREEIQHKQQLLSWMQAADQQIQTAASTVQPPTNVHSSASWLSITQDSLVHNSLSKDVTQLVQADNDSVKLAFQQVDFDLLISWLTELWQQQGLVVSQSTITTSPSPGMVKADIILRPA